MEIKMLEIHHHRNGIAGEPFYVGFLEDDDSGKKPAARKCAGESNQMRRLLRCVPSFNSWLPSC